MSRAIWPLHQGRPAVQVSLTLALSHQLLPRLLLADSGAGSMRSDFELILAEDDCLLCNGRAGQMIKLGGAYRGTFPVYLLPVQIPLLGVDQIVRAVGVPSPPAGFEGIACFRFLNRFAYSNFGDPGQFGLEMSQR